MKTATPENAFPTKEAAGKSVAAKLSKPLQKRIDRAFKLDLVRRAAELTRISGELSSGFAVEVLWRALKEFDGKALPEIEEGQSFRLMTTMIVALADPIDMHGFDVLIKDLPDLTPDAQLVAIMGFGPKLKEAQAELVFDIVENWEDKDNRVRAYGALAPVVDSELLSSLLVSTLELESSEYQMSALHNMLDSLPQGLAAMAFDGVGDRYEYSQGLTMRALLLSRMDATTRNDNLLAVQHQAYGVSEPFERGEVLRILHTLLAKRLQGGNLQNIIAADEKIEHPSTKVDAYFRTARLLNIEEARERRSQAIDLAFSTEGDEHSWALETAARHISQLGIKEGGDYAQEVLSRITDKASLEVLARINQLLSWDQIEPGPGLEGDSGALERAGDEEAVTEPQAQAEDSTAVEMGPDKVSELSEASDEPPPEESVIDIPGSEEGVEAFTQASYSERARSGLRFAAKLAKVTYKPIDSVAILCGLLVTAALEGPLPKVPVSDGEDNEEAAPPTDSPRWLWQHLIQSFGEGDESSERVDNPIRFLGLDTEFGIDTLPKSGARVSPPQGFDPDGLFILTRAGRIAQDVSGLDRVTAHHLLGALLTHDDPAPRVQEWLRGICGPLADQLGLDLLNARMDLWEDRSESIDVWRELVARQPFYAVGQENDQSPGQPSMAGYESDYVLLENSKNPIELPDPLGVDIDVDALSQIAMAHSVKPPMSIGLFGDWGSGKTYFMALMTQKISMLEAAAKKAKENAEGTAEDKAKATSYCSDVCQIHFNAWHFIDTNLWASIVTRVFTSLAEYFGSKEQENNPWEVLLEQTTHSGPRLKQAKEALDGAERKVKNAENDVNHRTKAVYVIDRAIEKRKQKPPSVQDFIEIAFSDPKIKEKLAKCADDLGILSLKNSVDEFATGLKRANSLMGRTRILWKKLGDSNTKRIGIAFAAIAIIIVPSLIAGLNSRFFSTEAGSSFHLALTGGVTLIGLIVDRLVLLRSAFDNANDALARLENAQTMVSEQATYVLRSERERLLDSRDLAQQKLAAANTALTRAQADKKEAESIRERVCSGAFIGDFIRERSENPNYKDQLGIIDEIRNDLEGLTTVLNSQNKFNSGAKRLDRIILYIDDLDRCSSERVVEVLQSVHLLLAFKLFVVVVGVDSRWLLHALQEQYSAFSGASGSSTLERLRWRTTPHNYLEKIFQIPFTLRPMGDTGFRDLIDHLTASNAADADPLASQDTTGETGEVVIAAGSKGDLVQTGPDSRDDVVSSVDGSSEEAQDEQSDRSLDEEQISPRDTGDVLPKDEIPEYSPAETDASSPGASGDPSPDGSRPLQPIQRLAVITTDGESYDKAGLASEPIGSSEPGSKAEDGVAEDGADDATDRDGLADAENSAAETAGESADTFLDPKPEALEITVHERDLMVELDELIPTPRAAKRFVNVYRIIKATIRDSAKLEQFIGNPETGGDYQAVMIMLGLQAGFATQAYEIFLHLASKKPTGSWWELVDGLKPIPSETDSDNWEISALSLTGLSDAEAEAWRELHMAVTLQEREMSIPDDLRPFVEYATVVARFGFITGRAVVAVRDTPSKNSVPVPT